MQGGVTVSASPNVTDFVWTKRREKAAQLVAADEQTDEQIAAAVGITKRQLERWKRHPAFQARVAEHVQAWRERILAEGVAVREKRVEALNERWERLRRLIAARTEDLRDETPGGETGLLVREPMLVKVYEASELDDGASLLPTKESRIVYKYTLDAALLKELREIEKQAAIELGQWEEKQVNSGKLSIVVEYADPDADDADN